MSLLFFLKPKFFDGTAPAPEIGGHFVHYDPKAFKRYQDQLKRKYDRRKHEPKERIVVEAEDFPGAEKPLIEPLSFDAFQAVAGMLASQAEQAIKAEQAVATLEKLLEQYQAQKAEAEQQLAIQRALAEQAEMEEMIRYAEMLRLRKKRRAEEEAIVLMLLRAH